MILKCRKCGLAITTIERDGYIILSESELLPKLHVKELNYRCPYCKETMEIENDCTM